MTRHLACMAAMLTLVGCVRSLDREIARLGYVPVLAPSTNYAPGTVVTTRPGRGGVSVVPVCPPQDALGDVVPLMSDSTRVAHRRLTSIAFALDTSALERVGVSLGMAGLRGVEVQLDEVRVVDLPTSAAFRDPGSFPTSAYRRAIAWHGERGDALGLVTSVLVADVVWGLHYDRRVTADARAEATAEVAAALGLRGVQVGRSRIQGQDLYVGIRDGVVPFERDDGGRTVWARPDAGQDDGPTPRQAVSVPRWAAKSDPEGPGTPW